MTALAVRGAPPDMAAIESVLIRGDLAPLTPEQRLSYYKSVCESVGLNPLTQPFAYIQLNGKLKLYALKDATDQLRALHKVSVVEATDTTVKDIHIVTVKVQNASGRTDIAKGAVALGNLSGENLANAIMKAETKAKRRATLSLCGLGMLDEVELDAIPGAQTEPLYTPPPAKAKPAPKGERGGATGIASAASAAASAPPSHGTIATPAPAGSSAASAEQPALRGGPPAPDATPTRAAPPPADPELTELVFRVRQLTLKPAPDGMGWETTHAGNWLKKYFGVRSPTGLAKAQLTDACLLLMTRLRTPEIYPSRLEQFFSEERILTAEYEA